MAKAQTSAEAGPLPPPNAIDVQKASSTAIPKMPAIAYRVKKICVANRDNAMANIGKHVNPRIKAASGKSSERLFITSASLSLGGGRKTFNAKYNPPTQ